MTAPTVGEVRSDLLAMIPGPKGEDVWVVENPDAHQRVRAGRTSYRRLSARFFIRDDGALIPVWVPDRAADQRGDTL